MNAEVQMAPALYHRSAHSRLERIEYGDPTVQPEVTVVIPTLDGRRRGLLRKLLKDLGDQTLRRLEVLLILGDRRQGRAINRGVSEARAEIVVTMDDDTVIGTPRLLENLVQILERHPGIGMVGASTVIPQDADWFQRAASRQIPRRLFPVVESITDSDMVQHPCLGMRKELFVELGGEDEELIRGLDPLLRFKVRQAGYRVVIAPHTYISHPLPNTYWEVLRMYYRNGRGSAFAQRHYPRRIYNLADGFRRNRFPARLAFPLRIARYPLRMLRSVLTGCWIRLSVEICYGAGYVYELCFARRNNTSARP
ncbi:MAG: glycosyltransferase [Planctomycetota bacterium]